MKAENGLNVITNDLLNLFAMQRNLDDATFKKNDVDEHFVKKYVNMALLDEFGEFTHELKGYWCWWKDVEVDKGKVLEEFADCIHFMLCEAILFDGEPDFIFGFNRAVNSSMFFEDQQEEISTKYQTLAGNIAVCGSNHLWGANFEQKGESFAIIMKFMIDLGFSWQEIFLAYRTKNRENYRRLEK